MLIFVNFYSGGIKKSEAAKKQRELKKFGKQIQHEKLKQREQDKKGLDSRLQGIKRSRFTVLYDSSTIPSPQESPTSLPGTSSYTKGTGC